MGNKQVNVAIYTRVSTREQAEEGFSLPAQEKTLREHCERKGYAVACVYTDAGLSAKDIKHRPEMKRLLDDVPSGKFDKILVWKLSRFSRTMTDLCNIWDLLDKHGVDFESFSESFDCSTPTGRLTRNIIALIAQFDREVISENVKLGMKERAMQGRPTSSYILGYDRVDDTLIVNKKESKIVREIFELYEQHKNLSKVADICRKKGYCGKKGGRIDSESIHKILTRFVYCGYCGWHNTPIKAKHKPIISVAQYNRVQDLISATGLSAGRSRKNPLVRLPAE